jgi:phosphatidylserine/phosphatidylglycerophosphate/cardiolipin synthase-like enzyme
MRVMNRCTLLLTTLGLTFWVALCSCATVPPEKTSPPSWEVYFSPNGGCTDAIVRELDKAQSTVLVQAYFFTSNRIAKALLDAHKRGVKVEVILDKSQKTDQYSSADFLANSGISTKIDAAHAIAHNKVMIIDGETGT